jgi:hypothetical protein
MNMTYVRIFNDTLDTLPLDVIFYLSKNLIKKL